MSKEAEDPQDVPEPDPAARGGADGDVSEEAGPADEEQETGVGPEPGEEIAALKDKVLRTMAELENFRRRAEREREDTARFAIANFARDCLTTIDNLRRGLESVSDEDRKANPALESLAQGMELTEREFLGVLERNGVSRIEALGTPFDHDLHQALFEIDDPEKPAGTVAQVTQEGYVLNGRLLRPAMVGVTKGGAKPESVQAPIANVEAKDDPDEKPPEPEQDKAGGYDTKA